MTLFELAALLLQTTADHYVSEGVPVPARQLIADGAIARDCDQLAVSVTRTYAGSPSALAPGTTASTGLVQRTAVLRVELARCVPTVSDSGKPPSPELVTASAETIHADHDLLTTAAREFVKAVRERCGEAVVGDALPFGPEGGLAGWGVEVRVLIG